MGGNMTKKEKDIRHYRTKKRMNDAMIELLKIKNFNQITVKDICEKATISRSGFYLHYMDKYDLVEKYQLELMKQINRIIDEETKRNASMEEIMIKILYFFKKEGLLLGLLLSNKGSVEIQNQVKKALQQNGLKNVLSYINIKFETEIEKHYLVIFFSNAAFGLLQEWINNGQKESPEELVRILNKIVPYKFI